MDKIIEKINKLSLSATILIVAIILGGFYFAVEYNKQRSIGKQQQIKIEQEKQAKEEAEVALNTCIATAVRNYHDRWYRECKSQGELTTKCIDIHELSFDEYLEKYGLTVEDYVRERHLKPIEPNDSTSVHLSPARLDYMARADDECSCRLLVSIADRIDKSLEEDKAECFKRYPQQ